MKSIVECVPNFSEGRDRAKVEAIVAEARAVPGVLILDVETDADHNRCVLSFAAPPEAALEACFRVAAKAAELIDLNQHKGEHPRMGAVDVIPFIPVSGVDIRGCAALAGRLAERIGKELEIPVYLYDQAARVPSRKDLAAVRKGQFEGLRGEIGVNPDRAPDFGPHRIHPTAGATAVGARRQIINFNLNLSTHDMELGKSIAKRVRASGGGLPAVRAKEIDLSSRGQVQISTVLTDYKATSIARVLSEVARLAREGGVEVKSTEIVGLLPQEALLDFAAETLRPENFKPEVQILERRLEAVGASSVPTPDWRQASEALAAALAGTDATPGGGSAAAVSGAMGCALGEMALGISLKSKKLDAARRPELEAARAKLEKLRTEFHMLAGDDAASFDGFMAALSLPKEDLARPALMQKALLYAAEVPLDTARTAAEAYAAARDAVPLALGTVASDLNCALHLLRAAALSAAENVRINLGGIKDKAKAGELETALEEALSRTR